MTKISILMLLNYYYYLQLNLLHLYSAYPVSWSYGDGTGGSEENIGKVTNAAECVTKCFSRKRNGKLANGATVDAATGKTCYCEYGQTGRNNAKSWKNTFIRPRGSPTIYYFEFVCVCLNVSTFI